MKMLRTLLLATSAPLALAFKNDAGWKKDDEGNIVLDDSGNPTYVDANGAEQVVAPGFINRLNTEAAQHRQRANDAEKALQAFGDLDPKEAKDAIAKLKDVDLDALVNKGEIENVRTQVKEAMQADIDAREATITEQRAKIEKLALDNAFNGSDFLKNRLAVPVDAARATFRDRFKVDDDGNVVPMNSNGEKLIDKDGNTASVDYAFQKFIDDRDDSDVWLKAPDSSGSGSGGAGGNTGTGNKMKRAEFDALPPAKQAEIGQKASKGQIEIVD